eukprot:scaffold41140_cov38-Cyclotella_meneghiniana.AAC.2
MFLHITKLNIYYLHLLDLVCCDFCSKSYHAKCHIPCLQLDDQVSDEKWKCYKCSKEHSTNPQQQRHNRLKVTDKFQSRAKTSLANLSDGWEAVTYKSKATEELHFLSPIYSVHFKSYKGAKLFDNVLLKSTDQPTAIKTFIKKYGNIKGMILNYSYTMSLATGAGKRTSTSLTTKAGHQIQTQGGKKKSKPSPGYRRGCKRTSSSESVALSKKQKLDQQKNNDLICFDLSSHNSHRASHKSLASKGWRFKREKSSRFRLSPIRKLQFYTQEAASAFEKDRQKCEGDEYMAAKLFYKKMIKRKPGTPFGKLLKGGLGSLFSESTAPKENAKPKHHAFDHQSECNSSANLLLTKKKTTDNNIQSKFEARRADLSNGWVAMPYKYSNKEEMHYQSPHYKICFRSHKGALLFDGILQNSTDESSAIQTFMNEHHNFRTMIFNFGRYEKKRRMIKLKSNSNFQSCDGSRIKSSSVDPTKKGKQKLHSFDRRKYLASKGWSFKPYKTSILSISPKRNLPFFFLKTAEQFEEDRQECDGNEYKAAELFIKRMQKQRTTIGNVLLGGLGILLGDRNTSSNQTSHLSTMAGKPDCKLKAKPQRKRKLCSTSTDSQPQKCQKIDSSLVDKNSASRFSKRIYERRQVKSKSDSSDMPNSSLTNKGSKDKARHIEDGYWEVEKVLKVRLLSGEMKCLVRWKGYTSDDDSWLPAENLDEKSFKEACELLSIVGYKQILTELLSGLIDALKKNDDDEKIFHTLNDVIDLPDYSEVDLMFSNCIKFNNEGPDQSNLYRTEAKRQRRKFGDLFKDALHQLQKRMDVAMKVDRS